MNIELLNIVTQLNCNFAFIVHILKVLLSPNLASKFLSKKIFLFLLIYLQ